MKQTVQNIYLNPLRQKYYPHDLGPSCYRYIPWAQFHKQAITNPQKQNLISQFKSNNNNSSSSKMLHNQSGISLSLKQNLSKTVKSPYKVRRIDHAIKTPNTSYLCVSFFYSIFDDQKSNNNQNNIFAISEQKTKVKKKPINTLIYLHTHNGSKLQGLTFVQPILSMGMNVCLFDFAAYGNSKGDYSTLGVQQSQDLQSVISFLQEQYEQVGFVLWGRSMGAVTAIFYLNMQNRLYQHNILGAVFDSPFSSLQKLTSQLLAKKLKISSTFVQPLVYWIKNTLKQKLNFKDLQLQGKVQNIQIPGLFLTSQSDDLIKCSHSQALYSRYKGSKQLIYIDEGHNVPRKEQCLKEAYQFVNKLNKDKNTKEKIVIQNILRFQNSLKQKTNY